MKDATFTLEFTTHVLANSVGPNDEKDHFQRDSENNLIWQQSWWYSAFTRAIELSHIRGIKASDISMNLSVKADTEVYKRRYGDGQFRKHEAIMPGTRLTFEAIVDDRITQSNLEVILDRMGKFVGLSPYGYRLGYGKFNVISVEVAPSEDSETSRVEKPAPEEKGEG
jgi:hypothetical protein